MLSSETQSASLAIGAQSIQFDLRTLPDITQEILNHEPTGWRTVVTPNLHHMRLLRQDPSLLDLYQDFDLLLPDGWPVAWMLSRIGNRRVDRVAGSDLLESILNASGGGRALVLVGGTDEETLAIVERRAAANGWQVVTEPAPRAEVEGEKTRKALLQRVSKRGHGGLVVIGLGAPKQELLAHEMRKLCGSGSILCLGMAINFSAGTVARAPVWIQKLRMEWIYRIKQEVRRLLPRYFKDAFYLPTLVLQNRRRLQ